MLPDVQHPLLVVSIVVLCALSDCSPTLYCLSSLEVLTYTRAVIFWINKETPVTHPYLFNKHARHVPPLDPGRARANPWPFVAGGDANARAGLSDVFDYPPASVSPTRRTLRVRVPHLAHELEMGPLFPVLLYFCSAI